MNINKTNDRYKKNSSHVTSNDTECLTGKFQVTAQYQKIWTELRLF
jgi:hypothetical protein